MGKINLPNWWGIVYDRKVKKRDIIAWVSGVVLGCLVVGCDTSAPEEKVVEEYVEYLVGRRNNEAEVKTARAALVGGGYKLTEDEWLRCVSQGDMETAENLVVCGVEVSFLSVLEGCELWMKLHQEKTSDEKVRDELWKKVMGSLLRMYVANDGDVTARGYFGETLLHLAANCENTDLLKYLVEKKGVDVNAEDDFGRTILFDVAIKGDKGLMVYLVEHGAEVGVKDVNEYTLLHAAALSGNEEVFRYLAEEHNLDIKAVSSTGVSVLSYAVKRGNLNIVKFLVERYKLKLNEQNVTRVTVLHDAVESGNLELVKYLLGCEVKWHDDFRYEKLLHVAVGNKSKDMVVYLVENHGMKLDSKLDFGDTLLHTATRSGSLEVIDYLISKGLNVNAKNEFDVTPLGEALECGRIDIVKHLVACGADVYTIAESGRSMLHHGVVSGDKEVVQYLVEKHGFEVNTKTNYGESVLHLACRYGNRDLVEYLIRKGANCHVKTEDAYTILHYAVMGGDVDLVKYLIEECGVDVRKKTDEGCTVVHEAAESGSSSIVKYLVETYGFDVNEKQSWEETSLHRVARGEEESLAKISLGSDGLLMLSEDKFSWMYTHKLRERLRVVEFLLEKGVEKNLQNEMGNTALYNAVYKGNCQIAMYLIDKGADITICDRDSVLHQASRNFDKKLVKYLVERGADVNERNIDGSTPLSCAVNTYDVDMGLVKYLVEHGADVNVVDYQNETPLDVVIKYKNNRAEKFLRSKGAKRGCEIKRP